MNVFLNIFSFLSLFAYRRGVDVSDTVMQLQMDYDRGAKWKFFESVASLAWSKPCGVFMLGLCIDGY